MQGLGNFRVSGLGLGPLEFRMLMGLRSFGVLRVLRSLKQI